MLSKCSRSYTIQRIKAFPSLSTCAFVSLFVSTHDRSPGIGREVILTFTYHTMFTILCLTPQNYLKYVLGSFIRVKFVLFLLCYHVLNPRWNETKVLIFGHLGVAIRTLYSVVSRIFYRRLLWPLFFAINKFPFQSVCTLDCLCMHCYIYPISCLDNVYRLVTNLWVYILY